MRAIDKFADHQELIPLKGNTKFPRDTGWPSTKYTDADIQAHANAGGNLGYRLKDREFVIDIDDANELEGVLELLGVDETLAELSNSVAIVQTSRGYHIYCELDEAVDASDMLNRKGNVDYLRTPRQVVFPGSCKGDFIYAYLGAGRSLLKVTVSMPIVKWLERDKSSGKQACVVVDDIGAFLSEIDVDAYQNDYDGWFGILSACATMTRGNGYDEFLEWCGSGSFTPDERVVESKWASIDIDHVRPNTHATLLRAVKETGGSNLKQLKTKVDDMKIEKVKQNVANNVDVDTGSKDIHKVLADALIIRDDMMVDGAGQLYLFDKIWIKSQQTRLRGKVLKYITPKLTDCMDLERSMRMVTSLTVAQLARDEVISDLENNDVITCKNGTINQADGSFTEGFDPYNYAVSMLGFNYLPESKGELFTRVLLEIFSGDQGVVDYFWEVVGYCMSFDKNLEAVWIFTGGGANGKSLVLKVIQALMGSFTYNTNTVESGLNGKRSSNTHFEAGLIGKRLLTVEDIDVNMLLNDEAVKRFSSNFEMTANPKGKDPFTFTSRLSLIMCANALPNVKDLSEGMRRRLNVIPFNMRFGEGKADPTIGRRIRESDDEMSSAMDNAMAGLQRVRDRGGRFDLDCNIPKEVRQAKTEWMYESNPMYQFVSEHVEKDENALPMLNTDLHAAYVKFMIEVAGDGERASSTKHLNSFGKGMRAMGYEMKSMIALDDGSRPRGRFWIGMRLVNIAPEVDPFNAK